MPKSEKGDYSANYLQNSANVDQVNHPLDTIYVPNIIMILPEAVLWIFCSQGSISLQYKSQKRDEKEG